MVIDRERGEVQVSGTTSAVWGWGWVSGTGTGSGSVVARYCFIVSAMVREPEEVGESLPGKKKILVSG